VAAVAPNHAAARSSRALPALLTVGLTTAGQSPGYRWERWPFRLPLGNRLATAGNCDRPGYRRATAWLPLGTV